jgi:hypothetical protein
VLQQDIFHRIAMISKSLNRPLKIHRIPQDDSGYKQGQTLSAVTLIFKAAISHFPEPVEEHSACERVARFPFI